jgi:hypothetical protein
MIEFMLLASPRSGTTWAANWLTTDTTLCLHDPLFTHHYSDLDQIKSNKRLGVSCTGLCLFPDFVNSHPARKVILHRDLREINRSLDAIGFPMITQQQHDKIDQIDGLHFDYKDIFTKPRSIYEYLTGLPFDEERHALLLDIEMQPKFSGLKVGKEVTRRLIKEMMEV